VTFVTYCVVATESIEQWIPIACIRRIKKEFAS